MKPIARPCVESFFDADTSTFTHVLHSTEGPDCAIIDPVLDFEPRAGRTSTRSADAVVEFVRRRGLQVRWLLETHAHADHFSAAPYLQSTLGGTIGIGCAILDVQAAFQKIFFLPSEYRLDGSQFDHLFQPDERFQVGALAVRAMHVPGHTPADLAYVVEDADGSPVLAFIGDTLFMPDVGSARCDFPGGSAERLYESAARLLEMPPQTRLFLCHDYPPGDREAVGETTVEAQRTGNIHLRAGIGKDQFVDMRERRDRTLAMPALMLPAIQVNIRGGKLPPPEANGQRYLKIPIDAF